MPSKPKQKPAPPKAELDRIIRLDELAPLLAVSNNTVFRWVREGSFPRPLKLNGGQPGSKGASGWPLSTVRQWMRDREASSRPVA